MMRLRDTGRVRVGGARHGLLVVVLLAGLMVVFFGGVVSQALAVSPWWHVTSSVRPSVLSPGGEGVVVVQAANVGDSEVAGVVTISDVLPGDLSVVEGGGVPAVSLEYFASNGPSELPGVCKVAGQRVSCVVGAGEAVVSPYEYFQLRIGVQAGVISREENGVEVAGGGAPTVRVSGPVVVGTGAVGFGVENYELVPEEEGGGVDGRAGSHPFQLTSTLALNQTGDVVSPPAMARNLQFKLPPGLVGNATVLPQCSELDFRKIQSAQNFCPPDTAVGVALVSFVEPRNPGVHTWPLPLFNLVPAYGEPARFGFTAIKTPVTIDTSVRTGSDYGVTATVSNTSEVINFLASTVVFWGVPGDPRHELSRGWACLGGGFNESNGESCSVGTPQGSPPPFLTLPTSCESPFVSSVSGESWPKKASPESAPESSSFPETTYALRDAFGRPVGVTSCDDLPFEPQISLAPDVQQASTSTGLKVDVHVPGEVSKNAAGVASSAVKDITVALPEGVQVNPSGGDGLQACSEALVGFEGFKEFNPESEPHNQTALFTPSLGSPFCPTAAKVGTVRITVPILAHPVEGAVYLASQNANPFGSLIAMYVVAEDPADGILIKQAGEVHLTATGQLITTIKNIPDAPLEDAELHFFGGERAPLATPAHCGSYTTNATFVPWAAEKWDETAATTRVSSSFQITSGPNGTACPGASLPFTPTLTGGATNISAGGFTPLTTTISRADGQQNLQTVQLHFPPGVSGILTGIPLCPEAQANEGTCPPESEIGETTVSAGVGSDPVSVKGGRVYLTEKYAGAPFGLSIVNPVKAGPFDLEHDTANPNNQPPCDCVVVRAKIELNPYTAALTATTSSIPHLIDGIPVQLRAVNVTINRPGFTFNPTNCNPTTITGAITSVENTISPVTTPFQSTNCANLKFAPKITVTTSGKTSKTNGASLTTKLTYPKNALGSYANIAKVKVDLPKQLPSRLTTLQKACPATTFENNPASCPTASIIGHAKVSTPLIPVPLTGPAYFVSHGNEAFPSLTIVLQGYGITINLVGSTFIKKGITSTTFKTTPDQPFNTFELTLPQGKYSALAANTNLCKTSKLNMPTAFTAQNGLEIHQTTKIKITNCPKPKTKHKHK